LKHSCALEWLKKSEQLYVSPLQEQAPVAGASVGTTTTIVFVGGGNKVSVGRVINVGAVVADGSAVLVGTVIMMFACVRAAAAVCVAPIA
jgi:hypothetical protein